ncbi:MAG: hypothetical protein IJ709_02940, partial [Selenomonas sp.]|nr:hypothetical protein [Selenomonas sp.]
CRALKHLIEIYSTTKFMLDFLFAGFHLQWGLETYSGGFRTIIPPISFQEIFTVYGSLSTTGSIVVGATKGTGTIINVISNANTAVNEFWLALGS